MKYKLMFNPLSIALEEDTSGKVNRETEYTLYARIVDLSILDKADSKEDQEQWQITIDKTDVNAASARMRVRKTTDQNGIQYVFTNKTKAKVGEDEVSIEATEDMFKQFKMVSDSGMVKRRFIFAIRDLNLKWEVDMFFNPDGSYFEWCKIDLEVPQELFTSDFKLPELPKGFTDVIYNQRGQRTKEEIEKITYLHDTVFSKKNEYL